MSKLGKLVSAAIIKPWPTDVAGKPIRDLEGVLNHLLVWPDIKHLFIFNGKCSYHLMGKVLGAGGKYLIIERSTEGYLISEQSWIGGELVLDIVERKSQLRFSNW